MITDRFWFQSLPNPLKTITLISLHWIAAWVAANPTRNRCNPRNAEQPKDFSRSDFPGGPGTSRTRHRSQGTWETLQPATPWPPETQLEWSLWSLRIFTLWFLTGSTQMSFPPSSHPIALLKTTGGPSFQYEVDWYSTLHWHGNSPEV